MNQFISHAGGILMYAYITVIKFISHHLLDIEKKNSRSLFTIL